MLQFERIDVPEGIDINNTNASKDCFFFHYWYFNGISYNSQPYTCNRCHDFTMMVYELKNIAILIIDVSHCV